MPITGSSPLRVEETRPEEGGGAVVVGTGVLGTEGVGPTTGTSSAYEGETGRGTTNDHDDTALNDKMNEMIKEGDHEPERFLG